MTEDEYKPLIDRNTSIEQVLTNFAELLEVLKDMVNYGSNLLPRCFASSKRKLEDVIILGVLLRQAIAMFDSIEVLVSNAAIYPSNLQLRAIFEVSLYLEWILQVDTEKRAKYYYVANLRQERMWASRSQSGSPENINFENIMAPLGDVIQNTVSRLSTEGQKYLQEINRILAQPTFAAIDLDFDNCRRGRSFDPPWYSLLGKPRSVRQLADSLQRLHEYELIYSESSEVMHSTSQKHHIKFSRGIVEFTPIRYLEGIDLVLCFAMGIMVEIYSSVLDYYRPEEKPAFIRKYIEYWRKEFLGIKKVQYKKTDTIQI